MKKKGETDRRKFLEFQNKLKGNRIITEEIIKMACPICKTIRDFVYKGDGTDMQNIPKLRFYDCMTCGDTMSMKYSVYDKLFKKDK